MQRFNLIFVTAVWNPKLVGINFDGGFDHED